MANLFHGFIYPQLVSLGRKRKEYQEAHSQTNGTHCNGIKKSRYRIQNERAHYEAMMSRLTACTSSPTDTLTRRMCSESNG